MTDDTIKVTPPAEWLENWTRTELEEIKYGINLLNIVLDRYETRWHLTQGKPLYINKAFVFTMHGNDLRDEVTHWAWWKLIEQKVMEAFSLAGWRVDWEVSADYHEGKTKVYTISLPDSLEKPKNDTHNK